jgi:2,3-bisphosphoglycerate-independent phosphoglycerate mutase
MGERAMNTMLMILDGFGSNPSVYGNAIAQARTPNLDRLFSNHPHTTIRACGMAVGLPEGQMGNSEVGHLNIGAGRIVYQELTRIDKDIADGGFFENTALVSVMDHVVVQDSSLHLMGLLSDGGVHSHIDHLLALLSMAKAKGLTKVFVHAFLDGRDVPPRSAAIFFEQLEAHMDRLGIGGIATISGRYYAMDRDNRWERVQKAYDSQTLGVGEIADNALQALEMAYLRGENDEFVLPTVLSDSNGPVASIKDHDGVIFFNFRPDRSRELCRCYVDPKFSGFQRQSIADDLHFVCLTQYDLTMPNVEVAYPPHSLSNTLGEYLSQLGFRQLRIAETEKYAHVTFFFNGGIEFPNPGEDRVLVPSPKVATYDLKPEMSAYEVTDEVLKRIYERKYDFIVLNYANPDMVGHTGIIPAAVKAIETLDVCVERVANAIKDTGGQLIITADHGNADQMLNEDGSVMTAHSLNPVPFLVIGKENYTLSDGGILADVAPTLLDLTGVAQPPEMTGRSLLIRE